MLVLALVAIIITAIAAGMAGFLACMFVVFKAGELQKEQEEKK